MSHLSICELHALEKIDVLQGIFAQSSTFFDNISTWNLFCAIVACNDKSSPLYLVFANYTPEFMRRALRSAEARAIASYGNKETVCDIHILFEHLSVVMTEPLDTKNLESAYMRELANARNKTLQQVPEQSRLFKAEDRASLKEMTSESVVYMQEHIKRPGASSSRITVYNETYV